MNAVNALSVRNLSYSLAGRSLLNNISFELFGGELTVLLGPNGAGKSTLLKCLAGEQHATGEIGYLGRKEWSAHELAQHMALLPQHSTLNFPFTAQEVIELGSTPLSMTRRECRYNAQHYSELTHTQHLRSRLYPTLSGGEKQRIHMARVLLQLHQAEQQAILLLDEPTSALDPEHQHQTLRLARRLAHEQNYCVVVVLHDLNLAAQYGDRLLTLAHGEIFQHGSPWDVLTPEHIETLYGYHTQIISHPTMGYPVVLPR